MESRKNPLEGKGRPQKRNELATTAKHTDPQASAKQSKTGLHAQHTRAIQKLVSVACVQVNRASVSNQRIRQRSPQPPPSAQQQALKPSRTSLRSITHCRFILPQQQQQTQTAATYDLAHHPPFVSCVIPFDLRSNTSNPRKCVTPDTRTSHTHSRKQV